METTFTQRLGRGIGSSALAQVIGSLKSILLVPLFLRAWDAEGYGRWLFLTALISYLRLLDLGGQSYVGNLLAIAYAQQDAARFRRVLSAGVSLFLTLSLGALLVVVLVASWPGIPFPGEGRRLTLDERLVLACMSASLLIAVTGGVYVTVYRATGLYARGTMVRNITRLFGLGMSAVLLAFAINPGWYAAGMLGQGILTTLAVIWDTQRQIPECRGIRLSLDAAREGLAFLGGSLYFWLIALAQAVKQQGVVLVLAALGSPVAVALFSTHRAAAGLQRYIGNLLGGPLWPEFSFLWARKQHAKIERLVITLTGLLVLTTGVAAIGGYVFFPRIYPIWTGKELDVQMSLFGLLLIQSLLATGWLAAQWSLMGTNQHKWLAIWTVLNGLVTIVGAALLVSRWGVLGVGLAGLIGDVTCSLIVLPVLVSKSLQISARRIYRTILLALLVLAPFAVGTSILADRLSDWLAIIVLGVTVIALGYPTLVLVLGYRETNELIDRLRRYARGLTKAMWSAVVRAMLFQRGTSDG